MPYLMLIVEPRGQRAARSPEEAHAAYDAMVAYGAGLKAEGRLLAVESLRPDELAVRISSPEGKIQLRDGPFAEAKELVGGFFLLNVEDREQALAWARRCPAAAFAQVEVRETGPCFT